MIILWKLLIQEKHIQSCSARMASNANTKATIVTIAIMHGIYNKLAQCMNIPMSTSSENLVNLSFMVLLEYSFWILLINWILLTNCFKVSKESKSLKNRRYTNGFHKI